MFVFQRYGWMKRSAYLANLWPLWRFPSCRFPLQPFISPERCMPNVGPKRPSVLFVPEDYSPEVKLPGREVNHSLSSSADVKNATNYTFIPTYAFTAFCKIKEICSVISCVVTLSGVANQALFDTDSCLRRAKTAQITAVGCYCWLCVDDVRLSRPFSTHVLLLGSSSEARCSWGHPFPITTSHWSIWQRG